MQVLKTLRKLYEPGSKIFAMEILCYTSKLFFETLSIYWFLTIIDLATPINILNYFIINLIHKLILLHYI